MNYKVLFVRDSEVGGYTVRVPALPGCVTQGDSLPEALDNAREAISLYLDHLTSEDEAAPSDVTAVELYEWEDEALVLRVSVGEAAQVA